jgi:NTP pyrophosphatase (non-canonical NTP hydrolase)
MRTIQDFQAFHRWLDEQKDFDTDLLLNMVLLTAEVGEVAEVLRKIRRRVRQAQREPDPPEEQAVMEVAFSEYHEDLGQELADCIAYIFKLANYTGIDLQEAYIKKMAKNLDREWAWGVIEETDNSD